MPLIQWIMQNLNNTKNYGVVVGGTAGVTFYVADAAGSPATGVVAGGTAIVGVTRDVIEATGGAIIGGLAQFYITIDIGGGVVVGGTTVPTYSFVATTSGGAIVNGSSVVTTSHIYDEVGSSQGVVCGGSGVVTRDASGDCHKPLLPNHPKPSTADYSPHNIAPLIEFFTPIVASVLGQSLDKCNVIFRYENNTPCIYEDDIFVPHPLCIGLPYTKEPLPTEKSPELIHYEEVAKKSERLRQYMIASPAKIEYFHDL